MAETGDDGLLREHLLDLADDADAIATELGPEPGQPNRKKRIREAARTQRTNPGTGVLLWLERLF
jgi:hypothetical protein